MLIAVFSLQLSVFADMFVPEFDTMQNLRCDFEETLYNPDNSIVSTSRQFRNFKLDDINKKIYLQKEPIDRIVYYENDKIEFNLQTMSDDTISMSHTIIDRNNMTYSSTAQITYDNYMFGTKYSKSQGRCRFMD